MADPAPHEPQEAPPPQDADARVERALRGLVTRVVELEQRLTVLEGRAIPAAPPAAAAPTPTPTPTESEG